MSLLAGACALIVFHGYGGQTMSEAGKIAMSTGDMFVSPITVCEITRKIVPGKLERPCPPAFNGSLAEWLHMDRMLIAAALDRGLTIVTGDGVFEDYGVPTLWSAHARAIRRLTGLSV